MSSHFIAVEYCIDGKEIYGGFSDVETALASTPCRNVEEWDGTRVRRWWSTVDHSEWREGPMQ